MYLEKITDFWPKVSCELLEWCVLGKMEICHFQQNKSWAHQETKGKGPPVIGRFELVADTPAWWNCIHDVRQQCYFKSPLGREHKIVAQDGCQHCKHRLPGLPSRLHCLTHHKHPGKAWKRHPLIQDGPLSRLADDPCQLHRSIKQHNPHHHIEQVSINILYCIELAVWQESVHSPVNCNQHVADIHQCISRHLDQTWEWNWPQFGICWFSIMLKASLHLQGIV